MRPKVFQTRSISHVLKQSNVKLPTVGSLMEYVFQHTLSSALFKDVGAYRPSLLLLGWQFPIFYVS